MRGSFLAIYCLSALLLMGLSSVQPEEQLEQETISIMGNRGRPTTLFIVPWKKSGDTLQSEELESSIERSLEPLDRDVFRRELEYASEGFNIE